MPAADAGETKLIVRQGQAAVKIEVNYVMRGTANPVGHASLRPAAREAQMADLDLRVVSLEDVYGGKPVAALDVMRLFANEGITPGIRRAFVVYPASSNRPLHDHFGGMRSGFFIAGHPSP